MRKSLSTNKILLAIQYWNGDKEQACKLARLIADIEPELSKQADFLFVARFDCEHDQATVKYVARKFKTFTHKSQRRGTGWPAGCNGLFFGMLEWFYHKKAAGQILPYKAVLAFEADSIPMSVNWISELIKQWDLVNTRGPVGIAGAWLENGPIPDCGHINGNALITGDLTFLKWLVTRIVDVNVNIGWDYILAPQFRDHGWADMPQIRSVWRQPITEEIFLQQMSEGTLFYHGIKNDLGIKLCRKFLLGQQSP